MSESCYPLHLRKDLWILHGFSGKFIVYGFYDGILSRSNGWMHAYMGFRVHRSI
jgi:hypothetical protein